MNVDTNALLTALRMWLANPRHVVIGAVAVLLFSLASYVMWRIVILILRCLREYVRSAVARWWVWRRVSLPPAESSVVLDDEPWCGIDVAGLDPERLREHFEEIVRDVDASKSAPSAIQPRDTTRAPLRWIKRVSR